jgi:hypothetical protein
MLFNGYVPRGRSCTASGRWRSARPGHVPSRDAYLKRLARIVIDLAPARRLLPGRSSPFAPSLALRWKREPPWAIFISPSKRRQQDFSDQLFEKWIVSTLCLTTTNQPN